MGEEGIANCKREIENWDNTPAGEKGREAGLLRGAAWRRWDEVKTAKNG